MSYHIHHTEALILGSRPVGEADKVLFFYTKELGYVAARAKSIRLLRSRLRYVVTPYSHAEIDLIEGKAGWRMISARPVKFWRDIHRVRQKREIAANYCALLIRLVQGESGHSDLFHDMVNGLEALNGAEAHDVLPDIETILVTRLLSALGYWGDEVPEGSFLGDDPWKSEVFDEVRRLRSPLLATINRALKESQL